MKPYIIEEHGDGLLVFMINRPDKRNAISYEVMDGLEEVLAIAMEDRIKILVITGAGDKAFCSGGDLSAFHSLKTSDAAYEMLSKMSNLLVKLLFLPKPTVALMNGTAVGGGCELASACDFRFASKHIKAGFIQGTLAITTGWGGGTFLSEKLLPANAMKMLMEASLYDAEQLLELGFVQSVFNGDPLENCRLFLNKMLTLEADVLKSYKGLFTNKWTAQNIEERVEQEVRRCAILWEGEAHHQKVSSFLSGK
ncbi:enoyl-CoA hydratase/isomerase family protein [Bacillus sp. FJAT-29790]|uniref:enoyl-CoA hydratase/isomerase family protein n=1 Tax=Bacillus sp. FJAT-29790 TaxID=1895002 RepID=UPI001C217EEA|nr:enoyl-CoA hydratase/isomerase family protein [Bacillus sp. FJAT-29790]MBU8877706.1 enoyl-CoA hydratase/isomerase family protein [Bacillus sp. FJAT-29790]